MGLSWLVIHGLQLCFVISISLHPYETESNAPLALVVGVGHSGTTLLCALLDNQQSLCCFQETSFLARPDPVQASVQLGQACAAEGKLSWVEKTPIHIRYLNEAARLFPQVRIIFLSRDPLDVIFSLRERIFLDNKSQHSRNRIQGDRAISLEEAISRWLNDTLSFLTFQHEKTYRVKYENLVRRPDTIVAQVLKWLNIPISSANLTTARNFHGLKRHEGRRELQIKGSITNRSIGEYASRATIDELCYVVSKVKEMSSLIGYELTNFQFCQYLPQRFLPRNYLTLLWSLPQNPLRLSPAQPMLFHHGFAVIEAPSFLHNFRNKYLLYFASRGKPSLSLAIANGVEGPWTFQSEVLFSLLNSGVRQIYVPDIHIGVRESVLYLYCYIETRFSTKMYIASSRDAVNFKFLPLRPLSSTRLRIFNVGGDEQYAFEFGSGKLLYSPSLETPFKPTKLRLPDKVQQVFVERYETLLRLFYTEAADNSTTVKLRCIFWNTSYPQGSRISRQTTLLQLNYAQKICACTPKSRKRYTIDEIHNPYVINSLNRTFLFFSCCSSSAIAVLELYNIGTCPPVQ
uniref:protein-tyrosine sulfotransferase n=1 Tax=Tetraselmis sp. GSL018 TaxID=582737 RepID=A0A061S117_9CHLO|mmetsp:Transcript_35108/g.83285  ORF Transcript_35108/g.83285 Transcript_35108/m.83285 type:complete len:573 (-) Transcript_35108:509-2227(-)